MEEVKASDRDDGLIKDLMKHYPAAPSFRLKRDDSTFSSGTALTKPSNVRKIAAEHGMRLLVGDGYAAISQWDIVSSETQFLIDRE